MTKEESIIRDLMSAVKTSSYPIPGHDQPGFKEGARIGLIETIAPANLEMLSAADRESDGVHLSQEYRVGSAVGNLLGRAFKIGQAQPVEVQ